MMARGRHPVGGDLTVTAIHTSTIHAICPHGGWDYYTVEVHATGVVLVEDIQAALDQVRGTKAYQEQIAEALSVDLGGCRVVLKGRHGTTDSEVSVG